MVRELFRGRCIQCIDEEIGDACDLTNKSTASDQSGDFDLVRRALTRDADAFRTIVRTHNRRLYRIARGVVRNDGEAEDIVQEAYLSAFTHLDHSAAILTRYLAFPHRDQ